MHAYCQRDVAWENRTHILCNAAKAVREALRPRPCSVVAGLAADLLRSRSELVTENALLRQQLIVAARKVKKPAFQRHERTLITLLAAVLPRWRDALLLVKPETVLRWHSEGFRLLWRWKSRSTKTPVCLPRARALDATLLPGQRSGRGRSVGVGAYGT